MEINIIKTNTLSDIQKEKISLLHRKCEEHDEKKIPVFMEEDMNYYENFECFYMAFLNEELVSYISCFVPGDGTAEIYGFTSPEYRNKGIFSKMHEEIVEKSEKIGVVRAYYMSKGKIADTLKVFKSKGIELDYSEYVLEFDFDKLETIGNYKIELKVKKEEGLTLELEDADEEGLTLELEAGDEEGLTLEFEAYEIDKEKVEGTAFEKEVPVGGCMAEITDNTASIYDVYINDEHRKKGFGNEMMNLTIRELINRGMKRIILQLSGENEAAKALYLRHGFKIIESLDYFTVV